MTASMFGNDRKALATAEMRSLIFARLGGAGAIGLGLLNLLYQDTLLSWQPLDGPPLAKTAVALLSGAILVASGAAMLTRGHARGGAGVAAGWIGLWAAVLHLPATVKADFAVAAMLGVAETMMMAIGLAAFAGGITPRAWPYLRFAAGVCCIVFGLSHFVYLEFTAQMVPSWLPLPHVIAGGTGAIHFIAGIMLATNTRPRVAAFVEASMMATFILLLHVPKVVLDPANRLEWTMLGIAMLLATSVAMFATALPVANSRPRADAV